MEVGIDQCAAIAGHMDRAALRREGFKSSLMAEMYEAVIGAMFLEGGFPAVRRVQTTKWPLPAKLSELPRPSASFTSRLLG